MGRRSPQRQASIMAQATAPTTAHHIATVDLGTRGTADVWIREPGMIDVDLPTSNGSIHSLSVDPTSAGLDADRLDTGDSYGFGNLTTDQAHALATALRAGINGEQVQPSPAVEAPAYLTTAEANWYRVAHDPKSTAAEVSTAHDELVASREEAADEAPTCPSWCVDQDWTRARGLWQTIHARRFGNVTVYLPQEQHDDGTRWVGACEVSVNLRHNYIGDEEGSFTVTEADTLSASLSEAVKWAARMDQQIAAHSVMPRTATR